MREEDMVRMAAVATTHPAHAPGMKMSRHSQKNTAMRPTHDLRAERRMECAMAEFKTTRGCGTRYGRKERSKHHDASYKFQVFEQQSKSPFRFGFGAVKGLRPAMIVLTEHFRIYFADDAPVRQQTSRN
jgi:hypothetical protein